MVLESRLDGHRLREGNHERDGSQSGFFPERDLFDQ
jgi:hypothetical protein